MRLIDADALKETLFIKFGNQLPNGLIDEIDNAPSVEPDKIQAIMSDYLVYRCEPQRLQGEWIERTEKITLDTYYECSNCKEPWTTIEGTPWQNMMNFCPNCGARMKGGAE